MGGGGGGLLHIQLHKFILQIASSSGSSTLSDRSRFRNFFRTNPTFENFAPGLLSTFQYYGWRSVQFLTQKENLFTDVSCNHGFLLLCLVANSQ